MPHGKLFLFALVLVFIPSTTWADDWPQWLGPKRDGVWREKGIVEKFGPKGPREVWRTPIGEGYSGPAVAQGKVFITDRIVDKGTKKPKDGFARSKANGEERVLCLDEKTGKVLWTYKYQVKYEIAYASGPRTTPVVEGDLVWAMGAMGDLVCLRVKDGEKVWHRKLIEDYKINPVPVWGFAGHPLLDGDRLICLVGGKGSIAVAFDKKTGKEVWKNLSDEEPGYCPPMLYEIDGVRQVILWHPGAVSSLNPETGEVNWSHRYYSTAKVIKAGLTAPTPRLSGNMLFVTAFYDGPLMLKVKGKEPPTVLWKGKSFGETPERTDGLHSIISTPVIQDGYIYGVDSYGELRCLDAKTGERKWSTVAATTGKELRWGNAFLVPQGDRFFLFNELGDLIIARLTPEKYDEIDRANILEPTNTLAPPPGRRVLWSHPAFANRCIYARNDRVIVCVSLAQE